jgi:hypothetical protein
MLVHGDDLMVLFYPIIFRDGDRKEVSITKKCDGILK